MGGNALNGICETRRFDRDEYFELEKEVVDKLRKIAPGCLVQPIQAYKNKPSFGDMDVLFWNSEPLHWPRLFVQEFDTKGYTKNGGVYSFEYKGVQIDLIVCSTENFFTSVFYFAYNDLGNFMGRIAHKMGFKYGHEGLSFVLKDGDYQFDELIVSRDPKAIVEFLGYDFNRFQQGFDELDDVFAYAASTQFFNKDIFLLHNRNHKSRVRDAKRKSYNAFLDWLEDPRLADVLPAYQWESMEERGGRKETAQFMLRAYEFFPEFKKTCQDALWRFERHLQAKKLFNGDLVREWTELDGPDLGKVMKSFREYVDGQKMTVTDFVLENGQDFCRKIVLNIKYGPIS